MVCSAAEGVDAAAGVWLIDHLYSFRVETYRQDLKDRPELLARLAAMMGLGEEEGEAEEEEEEEENKAAEEEVTTEEGGELGAAEGEEATTEAVKELAPASTSLQDADPYSPEQRKAYD